MQDRNDPPDKESNTEEDEGDDKKENEDIDKKDGKPEGKTKPSIVEDQIIKNNVLDSRELLSLRKDNVTYFIDGKSLDFGSQKLFERNEIRNLGGLALGKAIKYKKHYHIALPICEGQRESPTMILTQITAVIKN